MRVVAQQSRCRTGGQSRRSRLRRDAGRTAATISNATRRPHARRRDRWARRPRQVVAGALAHRHRPRPLRRGAAAGHDDRPRLRPHHAAERRGRSASSTCPGTCASSATCSPASARVDACVLVVAATEGWKPQTEEHLRILELVGVRHGLVVLTMADLVDDEWLQLQRLEVEDHLAGHVPRRTPRWSPAAPSPATGHAELLGALERLVAGDATGRGPPAAATVGRPRVRRTRQRHRGHRHAHRRMRCAPSSTVDVLPQRRAVRVRSIQTPRRSGSTEQGPGHRVALNLVGIDHTDDRARRRGRRRRAVAADGRASTPRCTCSATSTTTCPGAARTSPTSGPASTPVRAARARARRPSRRVATASSASTSHGTCRWSPATATCCARAAAPRPSAAARCSTSPPCCRRRAPVPDRDVWRVVARARPDRRRRARGAHRRARWRRPPAVGRSTRRRYAAMATALARPGRRRPRPRRRRARRACSRAVLAGLDGVGCATASPVSPAPWTTWRDASLRSTALAAGGMQPPDGTDVPRNDVRELVRRGLVVERDGICFHPDAIDAAAACARRAARRAAGRVHHVAVPRGRSAPPASSPSRSLTELDGRGITRRRGDLRVPGPRLARRLASRRTVLERTAPGGCPAARPSARAACSSSRAAWATRRSLVITSPKRSGSASSQLCEPSIDRALHARGDAQRLERLARHDAVARRPDDADRQALVAQLLELVTQVGAPRQAGDAQHRPRVAQHVRHEVLGHHRHDLGGLAQRPHVGREVQTPVPQRSFGDAPQRVALAPRRAADGVDQHQRAHLGPVLVGEAHGDAAAERVAHDHGGLGDLERRRGSR